MSGKRRADGPPVTKKPTKKSATGKKPPKTAKSRLKKAGIVVLILGLVGALLGVGTFIVLYQTIDVPQPNEAFETQTSFVYFSDGKSELGQYATQNRESIPLDEMPASIKDGVVAAEDRSFWTNQGIDPKGIIRAAFSNARGNSTQGASTITQQYVKILYLTQDRTLTRKIKEAFISLKLQREMSKEQILEGYLNTIYFGRGAYGIQAAAKAYFDIEAKDLTLRQSAVLASILNDPNDLDPANGKRAKRELKDRYQFVLSAMADEGMIEAAQADKAARRLPKFPEIAQQSQYGEQRGHVLTMVRNELSRLGYSPEEIEGGGLRVTTTFTEKAMDAAASGVAEARPDGFGDEQLHVAVATVEPGTGAVRGIFAGQDFLDSQINWAVAGGQAGSTMKAAALVAAIQDGFSLKDTFEGNSPLVLPDGTDFENQGDQDYGSAISMITAAENSVNTAFIDMTMSMEDGPEKIVKAANQLGIPPRKATSRRAPGFPNATPGLEPNIGVALGSATVSPINMANAYATLAAEGRAADPYIIEKVELANGEVDYRHKVSNEQSIKADIAADVTYALQQVSAAENAESALGRPVAGKTGTATNGLGEVSSAWFAGYTPQLSTAVMYVRGKGNEQLQGWLPSYFGSDYPAATWTAVMADATEGMEVQEFPEPAYVDLDDEEEEGHEPYTPPPSPTRTQPPSQQPTTQEPSEEPTTEEPSQTIEPSPTETTPGPTGCPPLQTCESESPSPTDDGTTDGGETGGATGAPAAYRSPIAMASPEAVRERYAA